MIEKSEVQEIAQKVFDCSPADETEVILSGQTDALTRFTNNIIHQNVAEDSNSVRNENIAATPMKSMKEGIDNISSFSGYF